jgi:hypothetical protein
MRHNVLITRRHFLKQTGTGLGLLGLAALCADADDTTPPDSPSCKTLRFEIEWLTIGS